MTARKLTVDMAEILDAMARAIEDPTNYFLDVREGHVVAIADDLMDGVDDDDDISRAIAEDPERYVRYLGSRAAMNTS